VTVAQIIYRMPSGDFLVATEPDRATAWSCDADGRWETSDGTWIEPRRFVIVNGAGELVLTYCAHRSDALDDYLYVQDLYWVSGKQLLSSMLEYGYPGGRYSSRLCSVKVIADGLEAIDPGSDLAARVLASTVTTPGAAPRT
jgi:hypothetical protein